MNSSLLAKILGWAQFGLNAIGQVTTSGIPHGALSWAAVIGSLLTAIGIHAASNTDGNK